MGCLHDPVNVQQTSSKCIQNTRANAGRLNAGSCKHPITVCSGDEAIECRARVLCGAERVESTHSARHLAMSTQILNTNGADEYNPNTHLCWSCEQ